jgi:hypothetical protein
MKEKMRRMSMKVAGPVPAVVVSLLEDVLRKVEASVLVKIKDYVNPSDTNDKRNSNSHVSSYHPPTDGIDFLDTKNTLLLSYMIDLVVHLRNYFIHVKEQQQQEHDGDTTTTLSHNNGTDSLRNNETRLMEMKVLLDKISTGLDRKLRYQIDKVLLHAAVSSTNTTMTDTSSAFATRTDPLQFRPGIVQQHQKGTPSLSDDDENDDDGKGIKNQDSDNDGDDDDDMDEDEDYRAARQTLRMASVTGTNTLSPKKSSTSRNHHDEEDEDDRTNTDGSNIYRAPRFMSTPYPNESSRTDNELPNVDDDYDDSTQLRQKEERYKQKLRNSEIVQTLREQLNDHRPEQDDIIGTGTGTGGLNGSSKNNNNNTMMQNREQYKFLQLQKEKLQFEEDYMIRLPRTKTERKQEQLFQRQREQNTISSITKDLHQIVRTGGGGGTGTSTHTLKYDARSNRHRPSPEPPPSEAKRKSVPKNSLQAALFGGGGSSNKKKKKR